MFIVISPTCPLFSLRLTKLHSESVLILKSSQVLAYSPRPFDFFSSNVFYLVLQLNTVSSFLHLKTLSYFLNNCQKPKSLLALFFVCMYSFVYYFSFAVLYVNSLMALIRCFFIYNRCWSVLIIIFIVLTAYLVK